jgi:hypothetical protein
VAAILQVSTDWFRDTTGLAWLDAVLVVVLVLGALGGPSLGFICGLLGGLVVGGPAGHALVTGVVYGAGGAVAARAWQGHGGVLRLAAVALLLTTLLSPAWDPALVSLGCVNAVITVGICSVAGVVRRREAL